MKEIFGFCAMQGKRKRVYFKNLSIRYDNETDAELVSSYITSNKLQNTVGAEVSLSLLEKARVWQEGEKREALFRADMKTGAEA